MGRLTVNLDAWNALSTEDQATIEALAAELEPTFWEVSKAEDAAKMAILAEYGLESVQPSDDMIAAMREAVASMTDDFIEANPDAKPVLDAFFKANGRM